MLTKEQVLEAVKSGERKSNCLDYRDFARLCNYFPPQEWPHFGFKLKEGAEPPSIKEWTEENIKKDLEEDLAFAFEKALNKRGISASLMYEVIKMWLWILEDPLQDFDEYAYYGLPLFKAVAMKYVFPNPIGDDTGTEWYYGTVTSKLMHIHKKIRGSKVIHAITTRKLLTGKPDALE